MRVLPPLTLVRVKEGHEATDDLPFEDLVDEEVRLATLVGRSLEAHAVLAVHKGELDDIAGFLLPLQPLLHVLVVQRLETFLLGMFLVGQADQWGLVLVLPFLLWVSENRGWNSRATRENSWLMCQHSSRNARVGRFLSHVDHIVGAHVLALDVNRVIQAIFCSFMALD